MLCTAKGMDPWFHETLDPEAVFPPPPAFVCGMEGGDATASELGNIL